MKLTKGRLIFVLLSLMIIILLGIMVGLQLLIITNPTVTTVNADRTDQASLSDQAKSPTALQVVLATTAPSATFTEMQLPSAPTLPATALPTSGPPTPEKVLEVPTMISTVNIALATATAPATATVTVTAAEPTIAQATDTPVATATVTSIAVAAATNTAAPPADIRLGETDRSIDCKFVTDIVQRFLERQMKLRVARVHFNGIDDLFRALASDDADQKVDLTLCYIDPDDRTYLQKYDSTLLLVAGNYAVREQKRLFAVGNSTLIVQLKTQQPCVYNFLKNLDFGDLQFPETDADQWLTQNSARTLAWSQCQ